MNRGLETLASLHGVETQYVDTSRKLHRPSSEVLVEILQALGSPISGESRPSLFAEGASVGCPPDEGFTSGQNWGFPPILPDRQREEGYSYLIASLRNHFRYAKALRLDHVMGFHRLYWIPDGIRSEGTYVRYSADEHYAILSVEASRRGAWVVGEDLGTVPPAVPVAIKRHGVRGLFVLQHALSSHDVRTSRELPAEVVASINTHDMPTFDGFWNGRDIAERIDLGLLNETVAKVERTNRPLLRSEWVAQLIQEGLLQETESADVPAIYRACCEWLARSNAAMIVLNLEDFWLEPEPQNIPGTDQERPNWRRKLRFTIEEFVERPEVLQLLRRVDSSCGDTSKR